MTSVYLRVVIFPAPQFQFASKQPDKFQCGHRRLTFLTRR